MGNIHVIESSIQKYTLNKNTNATFCFCFRFSLAGANPWNRGLDMIVLWQHSRWWSWMNGPIRTSGSHYGISAQILRNAFGDSWWWRNGHGEIILLCTWKKSFLKLGQRGVFHISRLCVQSSVLKCWSQGTGPSSAFVRSGRRNTTHTHTHTQIVLGVNGVIVR